LPPADTYPALERGVVDAVELLAPANDAPLGLNKIAPFYLFPGFNKPNGASEVLIGTKAWQALPKELQQLVETVCEAEHAAALAEAHTANVKALAELVAGGTRILRLKAEDLAPAAKLAEAILDRIATTSPEARRIIADLNAFRAASRGWSTLSRA
jgi:TRAP-type mannitol/chloroaromatic compound transport system substrate-binding protein